MKVTFVFVLLAALVQASSRKSEEGDKNWMEKAIMRFWPESSPDGRLTETAVARRRAVGVGTMMGMTAVIGRLAFPAVIGGWPVVALAGYAALMTVATAKSSSPEACYKMTTDGLIVWLGFWIVAFACTPTTSAIEGAAPVFLPWNSDTYLANAGCGVAWIAVFVLSFGVF